MLIEIAEVFSAHEVDEMRDLLLARPWVDGKQTAGVGSARVKCNRQLAEDDAVGVNLGQRILARLSEHGLFMSGALPKRIYPPLFNRYSGGEGFGFHIDNAIRGIKGVDSRAVVRRFPQRAGTGAARGLEITVLLDEKAFEGSGVFLLGAVLDRFFAEYAAMNHFTQTVIRTVERGEVMRFPPRAGARRIL